MHHIPWAKLSNAGAVLAAILGLLAAGPTTAATSPVLCAAAGRAPVAGGPRAPSTFYDAVPGQAYIHTSTSDNTALTADSSYLENPALNGQPATKLLVTSHVAPYGIEASGLDHALGVWYDSCVHQWAIYNDDKVSMTVGRSWNVFIPPQDPTLVLQDSNAGNSTGPQTRIADPLFHNDPQDIIFVQHVYNAGAPAASAGQGAGAAPQGAPVNYFTQTVGVTYNAISGTWAIQNEDGSNFQFSKTFFVLKASPDETAFSHTVTAGSHVFSAATVLDHPMLNGNPDAQILITQNLDGGVANNHRVGVTYDAPSGRWLIVNLDNAALALGARFNVLVIPPKHGAFAQEATGDNTSGNRVYIGPVPFGNPDLDNHPEALVYVTHNWNPPQADVQLYNDHPIGVRYFPNQGKWAVVNLDGALMQQGLWFNIYYTWGRGNSFSASASASNSSGSSTTLNNPLLNASPNAIPIITLNQTPAGQSSVITYTQPVGVRYYGPLSAWQIFNGGPTFNITQTENVLVPSLSTSFVVTTTGPSSNILVIDNALTNNHPDALVFISPRDNSGINPHNVGVYYNSGDRWAIFDENPLDIMSVGASYDVFVAGFKVYLPLVTK